MRHIWTITLSFCICIAFHNAVSAGIIVFSDNFDGGQQFAAGIGGGWSGVTNIESVQGYSGYGTGGNVFGGLFLRNKSTGNPASASILTLTNLPVHTSIDLGLLFAAIDSWDVVSTGDKFNITIDGVPFFSENFTSNPDASQQGYIPPPGVQLMARPFPQLGFNEGFEGRLGFEDGGYNLGLDPSFSNIIHTASTLTIQFFASGADWTGGGDESWGIENVEVRLNGVPPVPEPTSIAAWGLLGVAGLIYRVRRRTTS